MNSGKQPPVVPPDEAEQAIPATVRIASAEQTLKEATHQSESSQSYGIRSQAGSGSLLLGFTVFAANLLVAAALLATGVIVIQARAQAESNTAVPSLVSVQSVIIQRQAGYSVGERLMGRLEAAQVTDVAFEVGGTVQEVRVIEGDSVRSGDIVAVLDTRALKAQREQRLASRRQLMASVERAELDLQRERELERRGLTADQALDNARLSLDQALAAVEEMDAVLVSLNIAIDKASVKAPFTGVVGARYVDEGAVAGAGTRVITVFDVTNPEVIIGLPLDRLNDLVPGQHYPVFIDNKHYKATYLSARPDLNRQTRTVDARFAIEVPAGSTQPVFGQLVELDVVRQVNRTGYWVPVTSLVEGDRGLWTVLVVRSLDNATEIDTARSAGADKSSTEEHEIHSVHVDVLHAESSQAFIHADLDASARLVNDGGHRVVAGQRVVVATGIR